jgi:transposase-like protein
MSKFSKSLIKKICNLIKSDSYTIAELCAKVGISERSFYDWKAQNADFADALKEAEDERLNFYAVEAKKSLLKKLQGYMVQETKTVSVKGKKDENGKSVPLVKELTVIEKHIQPDTTAIIFTLTNTDNENWKNRLNNELTGSIKVDSRIRTKEELKAEIERIDKILETKKQS